MEPIDYDAEYDRLLREIDTLPADQQEALRAMHAESVVRHEEIQEARVRSQEAMAELQGRLQEMASGFERLDSALADLRIRAKMTLLDIEARRREDAPEGDEGPARD